MSGLLTVSVIRKKSLMFVDNPELDHVLRGVILTILALAWIIALVRLNGLRSFSKMTSFDFVATVATGSLLAGASQSSSWLGFLQTCAALGCIFAVQFLMAKGRQVSDTLESTIQNKPVLLMRNGQILMDALRRTRVDRSDLIAKLREANVLELSTVRAAVLEATGDVSVLHGEKLDEIILDGVERTTDH